MDFLKAQSLKNKYSYLIGEYHDTQRIDAIAIVPTNSQRFEEWKEIYLRTMNLEFASSCFSQLDVSIELLYNLDKIENGYFLHGQLLIYLHKNGEDIQDFI